MPVGYGYNMDDVKQVVCTVLGVWMATQPYGCSYRTPQEAAKHVLSVWNSIEHEIDEDNVDEVEGE